MTTEVHNDYKLKLIEYKRFGENTINIEGASRSNLKNACSRERKAKNWLPEISQQVLNVALKEIENQNSINHCELNTMKYNRKR